MIKKRFIAGATCPQCSETDSLVMYKKDDEEYRECVDCGFVEKLTFKPQARELETRVNKSEEEKQNETQVVKIIGASPKGSAN